MFFGNLFAVFEMTDDPLPPAGKINRAHRAYRRSVKGNHSRATRDATMDAYDQTLMAAVDNQITARHTKKKP